MDHNPDNSHILAAAITKAASKQTYYTIRFFADQDRVADAFGRGTGDFDGAVNVVVTHGDLLLESFWPLNGGLSYRTILLLFS